ncbi:MAG: aldolase/citrate lyase family protein [Rhodobacteraceae bacterium]|nr:aldolase/citrate lyase family protein [Paracoccaceae bacterium]
MEQNTVRLTVAQAIVRYLCHQHTEIEGQKVPLFAGVFAIFGHGNVTCLGEALENAKGELPTWRGQNEQAMTLAAIAYGLDVVDGVFNNISDPEGFIEEATSGREMGMSGKSLIHPNQINPANQVFSPSEEEIEEAQKIVDAFSTEESEGKGVIVVDGKMVERLHLEMARNVLMKAQFVKHL